MPFAGRKHHGDCRFGGTIANRTCLCRGAACRSRHNAADTNRLPLKWYAPIASVRFFGSRYGTAVPSRDCTPRALPRAQGATSAFGLLAMTIWGLLLFYRQPVPVVRAAPGAACRSPTTHGWPLGKTFRFPISIFRLRLPLPCNSPTKRRPRCGCSGAADCQKTCPAENFGGKKSVKGNRQGFLSRSITRRSGRIAK